MATYIKTLSDINGNVILPKTRSNAVYMGDNTTVEDKISSIITTLNTKSANGHTHKPDEAHPTNAYTKASGNGTTENFINQYTKIMSFTSTGAYGGMNILFAVRESNVKNGFGLMNLACRTVLENNGNDFCFLNCIAADDVGFSNIGPRFKVYFSGNTYNLYYIPDRSWMIMYISLINAKFHNGNVTWYSNQPFTSTVTGTLVATSKNTFSRTSMSTSIPTRLDDGAVHYVYQ